MHIVTFAFVIIETVMFVSQLQHYLSRPQDKQRGWFLMLLFLLIFYNVTGGLFPDANIGIPIVLQNILAYGGGFAVASYVPYYFYRGFELEDIRFHALYGVPLFLLLPYFVFFVILYAFNQNLENAIDYGIIIPCFYSFVILSAIARAIWKKYKKREFQDNRVEIIALYGAILPWVSMSFIAFFHVSQLVEVIITNGGFVFISILYFTRYISKARKEYEKFLDFTNNQRSEISPRYDRFELTAREIEIIELIRAGYKYKDIGEQLFISERTVTTHVQNVYSKMKVSNRVSLLRKLESAPLIHSEA
jgi:DNA-binding CsgD family transcriptional regulator